MASSWAAAQTEIAQLSHGSIGDRKESALHYRKKWTPISDKPIRLLMAFERRSYSGNVHTIGQSSALYVDVLDVRMMLFAAAAAAPAFSLSTGEERE